MTGSIAAAVDALAGRERILVFTGAGISTESGIPDFRGPDGLWTRVDPDDFTIERFLTNPRIRIDGWRMHAAGELWGARSAVHPNAAHLAVTRLWQSGRMTGCITQNIDGLHQAGGLPDQAVAELHGNSRKVACLSCRRQWSTEEILVRVDQGEEDPRCEHCGGLLKTTTVLFGEMLPDHEIMKASAFASEADAVVAVGTTLSVFPAADFALDVARRGVPLVIVNLGPTEGDRFATTHIEQAAGTALPLLFDTLLANH